MAFPLSITGWYMAFPLSITHAGIAVASSQPLIRKIAKIPSKIPAICFAVNRSLYMKIPIIKRIMEDTDFTINVVVITESSCNLKIARLDITVIHAKKSPDI